MALVDGREELADEMRSAPKELREYVGAEFGKLMDGERLEDGVYGQLRGDQASQRRAEEVVLPRVRELIGIGQI